MQCYKSVSEYNTFQTKCLNLGKKGYPGPSGGRLGPGYPPIVSHCRHGIFLLTLTDRGKIMERVETSVGRGTRFRIAQ